MIIELTKFILIKRYKYYNKNIEMKRKLLDGFDTFEYYFKFLEIINKGK